MSLIKRKKRGKLIEEISKANLPPEKTNIAIDRMIKWMLIYLLTLLGNVDLYLQLQFPDTYIPESDAYRPLDMQNYDHNRDIIKEFLSFMDEKRGPTRLSAMKPAARGGRAKKNVKKLDRNNLNFRLLDGEAQHKEWRELMRYLRVRDLANMLRICHTPRRNKDRFSFSLGLLCLGKRSRNFQLLCREFGVPVRKVWICKDEIEGLFKFQLRKPDDYERIGRKTFQAFKKKKDASDKNFGKEVKARLLNENQELERKARNASSIEPKSITRHVIKNETRMTQDRVTNNQLGPSLLKSEQNHNKEPQSGQFRPNNRPELAQDLANDVFIDDSRAESEHLMGRDMLYSHPRNIDHPKPLEISIKTFKGRDSIDSRNFPSNIIDIQSRTYIDRSSLAKNYPLHPLNSDMTRLSEKSFTFGKNLLSRISNPKNSLQPSKDQELLHFLETHFIPFYVENNLTDKVLEKYCDNSAYIPDFLCINREPGDNRGPKGTYLFQYVILSQYYSLEKLFLDFEGKKEKKGGKGGKRRKKSGGKKKKNGVKE